MHAYFTIVAFKKYTSLLLLCDFLSLSHCFYCSVRYDQLINYFRTKPPTVNVSWNPCEACHFLFINFTNFGQAYFNFGW